MKKPIVITTVGTTGDVLPYVALARTLVGRGHQVRFCTHPIHEERVRGLDVEFVGTGCDYGLSDLAMVLEFIEQFEDPIVQFEHLTDGVFLVDAEEQFAAHLEASRGAALVVSHFFDYVGQEAAIANDVPWVSASYMPDTLPTSEAPPYPFLNLGPWFSDLAWKAALERSQPLWSKVRAALQPLGVPERTLGIAGALSPRLHLLHASASLVEARGDWPTQVRLTGAWWESELGVLPDEVEAFLLRHPRPVVVSFGSMGGPSAEQTSRILLEALDLVGAPAIIQRGYAGLEVAESERRMLVSYVPHGRLFSRAGCVVHHAGSGTATSVARAGVPSVPVPHLFDQYYWAGMLARRGVASEPMPRGTLTAAALARAIEQTLMSEDLAQRARELGAAMGAERGVEVAASLLEEQLSER